MLYYDECIRNVSKKNLPNFSSILNDCYCSDWFHINLHNLVYWLIPAIESFNRTQMPRVIYVMIQSVIYIKSHNSSERLNKYPIYLVHRPCLYCLWLNLNASFNPTGYRLIVACQSTVRESKLLGCIDKPSTNDLFKINVYFCHSTSQD